MVIAESGESGEWAAGNTLERQGEIVRQPPFDSPVLKTGLQAWKTSQLMASSAAAAATEIPRGKPMPESYRKWRMPGDEA